MQTCFNIVSGQNWTSWNVEQLIPGQTLDVFGSPLRILDITEKVMVFRYRDTVCRIEREWQVLGTPDRFVFFFSRDRQADGEWSDEKAGELVRALYANQEKGEVWKNIPLVRQFIHELKDKAPFRSSVTNPAYKAYYLSRVLEEDFVCIKETPRLYQSLCELYCVYREVAEASDIDDYLREHVHEDTLPELDAWIQKLACIVVEPGSKEALACWDSLGGMLKTDPVQLSPAWEEIIYDVECELEAALKDEPRGMGFCFAYWSAKKAALARRGILWRSPAAMNPRVMFD